MADAIVAGNDKPVKQPKEDKVIKEVDPLEKYKSDKGHKVESHDAIRKDN